MDATIECLTSADIWANARTIKFAVLLVILSSVNILVIAGNILVIVTVAKYKKLRSVTNLFIVSLAFADLFLGIAILPFAIMFELLRWWIFGNAWCSMWLAIDVWLSTASILNLMAISLDRYIAVMHPIRYPTLMSRKRAKILIAVVWIVAFVVCLPPLINWGVTVNLPNVNLQNNSIDFLTDHNLQNNSHKLSSLPPNNYDYESSDYSETEHIHLPTNCTRSSDLICELTTSKGYRIYSSIGSFYLPMCVMAFFYIRIYKTAVETAAALRKGTLTTKSEGENSTNNMAITLRIHRGRGYNNTTNWKDKKRKENSKESYCCNNDKNPRGKTHQETPQQSSLHRKTKVRKKPDVETNCPKGYVHTFKKFQNRKFPLMSPLNANKCSSLTQVCKNPSIDTASISSGSDIIEMNQTNSYNINEQRDNSDEKHHLGLTQSQGDQTRRRSAGFNFKVVRKHAKTNRSKFKRETKAAKTLAIIVGAFVLCWLPFFTMYLVGAFCIDCIPPLMFSIFIWLGYCNSALNPCIYAMFSRDFRSAFKLLLTCRKYSIPNSKDNISHVQRTTHIHSVLRESESLSEF
ncbi:octopamine receptor Oamb-like [Argonauta hians]